MYIQAWKAFAEWCPSKVTFPTAPHVMCNYIGFLSLQHLAPRTISTRISALGYFHRLFDVQDPTAAFLVKKALRGVHTSTQYANDPRLPITKAILHQLLSAIDKVEPILNNRLLLKAFFLVTFYCCLRIGELAATKIHRSKVIQRQDVVCMKSGTEVSAFTITIRNHKTGVGKPPVTFSCEVKPEEEWCPVKYFYRYITVFKHTSGPLFQFVDGRSVSSAYISSRLKTLVSFIGLDPAKYKGHSFRIGSATQAASDGMSESAIQEMGRWKSRAVRNYIRINASKTK